MTATAQDVVVGDILGVTTTAGPVELDVAAIVTTSLPGFDSPHIIGAPEMAVDFGQAGPATVAYVAGDGATEAELTAAVGLPTLDVLTAEDYIDGLSSRLDTLLALVYALLALGSSPWSASPTPCRWPSRNGRARSRRCVRRGRACRRSSGR